MLTNIQIPNQCIKTLGFAIHRVFAHYGDLIWMSQWQFFLYFLDTRELIS